MATDERKDKLDSNGNPLADTGHQGPESDQKRRKFLKQLAVGTGSVTIFKSAHAQDNAGTLPPIVSLLLDDQPCTVALKQEITFVPISSGENKTQTLCVPPNANFAFIDVQGAGGSGTANRFVNQELFRDGASGGGGALANILANVADLDTLSIQVGEGGVAGEATEQGTGGEFGGAAGGIVSTAPSPLDRGVAGGGGGGRTAVLNGNEPIIIIGGGGGAGGGTGHSSSNGGRGGNGAQFENGAALRGQDGGGGNVPAGGGFFSEGGAGGNGDSSINGQNAVGFMGGRGGSNLNTDNEIAGGGGGGGGGGGRIGEEAIINSSGGGGGAGGGGAGAENSAGGAGGAGGGSQIDGALGEGSVSAESAGNGGAGGINQGGLAAGQSGGPGSVKITFFETLPD